jgi:hypothetical protein
MQYLVVEQYFPSNDSIPMSDTWITSNGFYMLRGQVSLNDMTRNKRNSQK